MDFPLPWEKMIIPAIIAKDQKELDENLKKVNDFLDLVQLDIMDGKFVLNNSLDFDFSSNSISIAS